MNRHIPYDFLTEKLAQMPAPDSNALWQNMKVVLDREMPEEKKKRRFFAWLFSSYALMALLGASGITAAAFYWNHNNSSAGSTAIASSELTSTSDAVSTEANVSTTQNTSTTNSITDSKISIASSATKVITSHNTVTLKAGKTTITSSKAGIHIASGSAGTVSRPGIKKHSSVKGNNTILSTQPAVAKPIQTQVADDNGDRNVESLNGLQQPKTTIKAANQRPVKVSGKYKTYRQDMFRVDSMTAAMRKLLPRYRGFSAGLDMGMNLPIGGQKMSMTSITGSKVPVLDYLPAIYGRYNFNRKWSAEAGLRLISPQYGKAQTLYDVSSDISSDHYSECEVSLEKLYYLDVPMTVHYQVNRKLNIGTGIQYSYLTRSVLTVENCNWDQGLDGWERTWSEKVISVHHNPTHEKKEYATKPADAADSVAMAFRPHDWRIVLNANYQFRKFSAGVNFNMAVNPYIQTSVNSYGKVSQVKESNRALQLYIRYTLWDQRRK